MQYYVDRSFTSLRTKTLWKQTVINLYKVQETQSITGLGNEVAVWLVYCSLWVRNRDMLWVRKNTKR